jgi:hypothetical protein
MHLARPEIVYGPKLRFRDATPDDAEFILSLRTDEAKNQHLPPVADDLGAQRQWLSRYASDPTQAYFIIEADDPVGTVRIYDPQGSSFAWGSWILRGAPFNSAMESALMTYATGLAMGFDRSHFEVAQGNEWVWKFHEEMGAIRTGDDDHSFHYSMSNEAIKSALAAQRYIPPIAVLMPENAANHYGTPGYAVAG